MKKAILAIFIVLLVAIPNLSWGAYGGLLKEDTAVDKLIGPFIDDSDGKTAETGLTVTQAEVRLSKNGGNMAQKNEATALTHDELGMYVCKLDATDTNTPGSLVVTVYESGALIVNMEYTVVSAIIYDSLYGAAATDYLPTDQVQLGGDTQSTTDLKDFADAGYDPANDRIVKVYQLTELDEDNTTIDVDGTTIGTCSVNSDMRGTDGANTTVPDAAGVAPTTAEIKTAMEAEGTSDLDAIADAVAHATYGLSAIETLVDDLETRLTAARAGYIDNLNGLDDISGFNLVETFDILAAKAAGKRTRTVDGANWDIFYFAVDDLTGVGTAVIEQQDVDSDGQVTGTITLTP